MSKAVSVPQGTAGHSCRAAGPQWLSGFYFSVDIMWIFFDLRFTSGLHPRSHPGPRQTREKHATWNNTEESQGSGDISAARDSSHPLTPTPNPPHPTPLFVLALAGGFVGAREQHPSPWPTRLTPRFISPGGPPLPQAVLLPPSPAALLPRCCLSAHLCSHRGCH